MAFKVEKVVGVIVAILLIEKVLGVERYNDRVMKINAVIGDVVWEVLVIVNRLVDQKMKRRSFMN